MKFVILKSNKIKYYKKRSQDIFYAVSTEPLNFSQSLVYLPSAVRLCKINVFSFPLFGNGYKESMEGRTCAEYITQSLYL